MRLPGAALLIVIGLVVLYLATTGQLDRLGTAWDYITNKTDSLGPNPTPTTVPTASGISDSSAYHAATLLNALDPSIGMGLTQPGGTH